MQDALCPPSFFMVHYVQATTGVGASESCKASVGSPALPPGISLCPGPVILGAAARGTVLLVPLNTGPNP
jgi:hypothetical protein